MASLDWSNLGTTVQWYPLVSGYALYNSGDPSNMRATGPALIPAGTSLDPVAQVFVQYLLLFPPVRFCS
ncbi:hypothetical protein AXG93_203s1050 [Marchantia polymorpha subsp. ruderalis]|uniref:Uncharacterized protein n=1 Tax=Marchantia polymorpha subsp. ruderalis TaxID=1480154 RepID=A0A176VKD2_MARPO|nr:hypothetical protein AXG93_203s1050 [Marchantia polymorpha subsp. ruderalis]